MPEKELNEKIETFIQENDTCALATASDGLVRCTPIEYRYFDGAFYLFSEGGLKFRCLKENKNVGLAVFASYKGFGQLKGLQVNGTAEVIEPFSEEYCRACERRKIPLDMMRKLPRPMNLIRITPSGFDYLDSDLKKAGYGSRQHLERRPVND